MFGREIKYSLYFILLINPNVWSRSLIFDLVPPLKNPMTFIVVYENLIY